jgi:hypothetical protein
MKHPDVETLVPIIKASSIVAHARDFSWQEIPQLKNRAIGSYCRIAITEDSLKTYNQWLDTFYEDDLKLAGKIPDASRLEERQKALNKYIPNVLFHDILTKMHIKYPELEYVLIHCDREPTDLWNNPIR